MLKSQFRAKSALRRPMSDVSNEVYDNQARILKKEMNQTVESEGSLDRLLVLRSDLSDLISQIDNLVAQTIKQKEISKKEYQEIESFIGFLSGIYSSLKPWFARLQEALTSTTTVISKDQIKNRSTPFPVKTKLTSKTDTPQQNLTISQSLANTSKVTLKSQIENHTTPYPYQRAQQNLVTSKTDTMQLDLLVSPSPLVSWRADHCTVVDGGKQLFLLTPLQKSKLEVSKTAPPKKPVINVHDTGTDKKHENKPLNKVPDISGAKMHEKHEIYCVPINKPAHDLKVINQKKEVSDTLDWFFSPPKTCVLMEPSDEKRPKEFPTPVDKNNRDGGGSEKILSGTPWNNLYMSATCTKKGEATLKRELWTRFEAVSTGDLRLNSDIFQNKDGKGFLDMLEEASS